MKWDCFSTVTMHGGRATKLSLRGTLTGRALKGRATGQLARRRSRETHPVGMLAPRPIRGTSLAEPILRLKLAWDQHGLAVVYWESWEVRYPCACQEVGRSHHKIIIGQESQSQELRPLQLRALCTWLQDDQAQGEQSTNLLMYLLLQRRRMNSLGHL